MTITEAANILDNFTKSIKDLRPNEIVQSESVLKDTKGRIKYAHFVYAEGLLEKGVLEKDHALMLMESYGIIDSFFVENFELINKKYREHISGLKDSFITDYILPNPWGENLPVLEFENFIEEIYFKLNKEYLLGKGHISESAYYDFLSHNKKGECDLDTRKKMVNSPLTKRVIFPGRKNDDESIFI